MKLIEVIIEEGAIGKSHVIHSNFLAIPPLCESGVDKSGWFADPYEASGVSFSDHAIYAVNKKRRYFDSEVKRVYFEMEKFVYKDWSVQMAR